MGLGWRSYAEAQAAIEALEPGRTTLADLRKAGIDPYATPNVTVLTFSEIALRFPVANIPVERLDAGLRKCLQAGKGCIGYSIAIRDVRHDRVGGFWQDSLGFKRVVEVTGWSFTALILLVDGRVVYTLHGGQPNLREVETSRQPLGPLQDWGDSVPGLLR